MSIEAQAKMAKEVRDAAQIAFRAFLLEAMQYQRPDGGSRTLTVTVTVSEDHTQTAITDITMVESGSGYEHRIMRTTLRG